MKNFIFKSSVRTPDLQKIVTIDLIQKNVLYLTYQCDKILKILQEMQTDKGLQKQVTDFYGTAADSSDSD